jgi:hypothetical protein
LEIVTANLIKIYVGNFSGSWSVTSFVFSKRLGRVASATPDPGTPVTGRP